ncbi:MAG: TatD family hydrolase [Motiliproteus sp.]
MIQSNSLLVDIAVNLTDKAFESDLPDLLARASAAGVGQMVITGSTLAESRRAMELCQQLGPQFGQQLYATAGVHPHYSRDFPIDGKEQIKALLKHACVKAVGETGLDFNRDFSPRPQQIHAFEQQLELAVELGQPILMHERDAGTTFYEMVKAHRDQFSKGVLHCFTGDREQLFRLLDLDLHIGITGWICDERRGQHLQSLLKEIPLDRLMLETDAPYLLPRDIRPKPKPRRNEPAYLQHICQRAAEFIGISTEQLTQATSHTARQFFNLDQQGHTAEK